jgi:hypothetical protein
MEDIVIPLLKFCLLLLWLLLLPVVLLVATPFVLLLPRQDDSRSFISVVFRRYWRLIWIWSLFGEASDVDAPKA